MRALDDLLGVEVPADAGPWSLLRGVRAEPEEVRLRIIIVRGVAAPCVELELRLLFGSDEALNMVLRKQPSGAPPADGGDAWKALPVAIKDGGRTRGCAQ